MKAEKKRPSAFRSIAFRVIGLTMALWLIANVLLTWAMAEDVRRQMLNDVQTWIRSFNNEDLRVAAEDTILPGAVEQNIIHDLGNPFLFLSIERPLPLMMSQRPGSMSSSDWLWGDWELVYSIEPAIVCYDENGDVIIASSSYLTFSYTFEENWKAGGTVVRGNGYVDLDRIEGAAEVMEQYLSDFPTGGDSLFSVLRLTGYFEGNQFCPVSIDRGYKSGEDTSIAALCSLDRGGVLHWENILTAQADTDRELETIYAWNVWGILFDYGPVTADGITYDSLPEMMQTCCADRGYYNIGNLWDCIFVLTRQINDSYGNFTYSLGVHFRPIPYVVQRTIPFYLISFAAVALLLFWILRQIRDGLTRPLERIVHAIRYGTTLVPTARWQEPAILEADFAQTRQDLAEANTQQQQLRTALSYAQDAEARRRQLVSNLTHELKTPLAVIHSYAEGLQEGIAKEKQERYLAVILEETERMDAMVAQMLDLSRLEAGKVRLTMTPCSLPELTRSVAEKFAPMLEAKGITVSLDPLDDFLITADEGRMEQVITNLMSNALKYTAPGGTIRIKLFIHRHAVHFKISNTCQPLSEEALQKVWDSFYRADPSRAESGTGLGLALVKSIIELHQGTCAVRNLVLESGDTQETAVEFSFTLPLAG